MHLNHEAKANPTYNELVWQRIGIRRKHERHIESTHRRGAPGDTVRSLAEDQLYKTDFLGTRNNQPVIITVSLNREMRQIRGREHERLMEHHLRRLGPRVGRSLP